MSASTSNLVKGYGGALLYKNMVDATFDKLVVVVDNTKLVSGFDDSGLAMSVEVVSEPLWWLVIVGNRTMAG